MAAAQGETVLTLTSRYASVSTVLRRVLALNLAVALVKIGYGYSSGTVSILSDGLHSLADSGSNLLALIGVRAARKPPDLDHPYGHRKFETLAAGGIVIFLLLALVEVLRSAVGRLAGGGAPAVTGVSFAVMLGTLGINLLVVRYERRAAERLGSEVLLADTHHTASDVLTSLTVIGALVAVRAGHPVLDPAAALVVAVFIVWSCYEIARDTTRILSDRVVIAEEDIRDVVMSASSVVGCHQIRTRGSADHVFLDLHVWFDPAMRLDQAHALSHEVKRRLMGRFPQIRDAIIHIEPPPGEK